MSGYRPAPLRSPTEDNFNRTGGPGTPSPSSDYHEYPGLGAASMTGSTSALNPGRSAPYQLSASVAGSGSSSHGGAAGRPGASLLSHNIVPSGGHKGSAEGELGPYSALRTRSAASSQSSSLQNTNDNSGMVALMGEKEPDDYLHEGDADKRSYAPSVRGLANAATLIILALALIMLFAGYPIIANLEEIFDNSNKGGYSLGGTNGSGQVPEFANLASLIDSDTPTDAQTWTNPVNQDTYHLVFSDEFEVEGRTFWEGDDPFWTAVDLWYGGTGDYEWYSPEAINTTGGALQIALEEHPTHELNFRSGMLQSWNKFCFQGGYIEYSVMQPGTPETTGYWPAAWLMGNLGRAGYLASTDGMWPYSYQSCDTGILPNQTFLNSSGPDQAIHSQGEYAQSNGYISELPGMRTPACTCSGGDHPGPNVNVGRSAPEIDCFEAQIQTRKGVTNSYSSQSLQAAPFDVDYYWKNTSDYITIYNDTTTEINSYVGGPLQEAVSSVALNPARGFQNTDGEYIRYGIQYDPDWKADGGGSVTWFIDGKPTWTAKGTAIGPSAEMDIGQRTVPTEPMYIIMNLGMSTGFQPTYFGTNANDMIFPALYRVDYVRVYQIDGGTDRITCDPSDHPTADYITKHPELYANPNLTDFASSGYTRPKNKLRDGC